MRHRSRRFLFDLGERRGPDLAPHEVAQRVRKDEIGGAVEHAAVATDERRGRGGLAKEPDVWAHGGEPVRQGCKERHLRPEHVVDAIPGDPELVDPIGGRVDHRCVRVRMGEVHLGHPEIPEERVV